jgi:hypothetical protein
MFAGASAFDQDLSSWDLCGKTNVDGLALEATNMSGESYPAACNDESVCVADTFC